MNLERALATPGFMAEIELQHLAWLAKASHSILEIGTWQGRSARCFADNTDGVVYCVDTFADNAYGSAPAEITCHPEWLWNEFNKNHAETIASGKVVPHRLNSSDGSLALAGKKFDVIFIDAGHRYEDVKADILNWRPFLYKWGVLCGHDYAEYHPGVMQAVQELVPNFLVFPNTTIWAGQ
jgi:hypothetical protein